MERTSRRLPISVPCELDGRSVGHSIDISLGGAFVRTGLRPALGAQYHIGIHLDCRVIDCDAEVVRHAADGIGVAFKGCSDTFRDDLRQVLGSEADLGDDLHGR